MSPVALQNGQNDFKEKMKTIILYIFVLIPMLILFSTLNLTYDLNGIHEDAVVCLLHSFMKNLAGAALNSSIRVSLKSNRPKKWRKFTKYCEVVNYLLETYVTDNIKSEVHAEIRRSRQPSNMRPMEYTDTFGITLSAAMRSMMNTSSRNIH